MAELGNQLQKLGFVHAEELAASDARHAPVLIGDGPCALRPSADRVSAPVYARNTKSKNFVNNLKSLRDAASTSETSCDLLRR